MIRRPPRSTPFPTRRSSDLADVELALCREFLQTFARGLLEQRQRPEGEDRKSTRLNSSHEWTPYAVFCLKKQSGMLPLARAEHGPRAAERLPGTHPLGEKPATRHHHQRGEFLFLVKRRTPQSTLFPYTTLFR